MLKFNKVILLRSENALLSRIRSKPSKYSVELIPSCMFSWAWLPITSSIYCRLQICSRPERPMNNSLWTRPIASEPHTLSGHGGDAARRAGAPNDTKGQVSGSDTRHLLPPIIHHQSCKKIQGNRKA